MKVPGKCLSSACAALLLQLPGAMPAAAAGDWELTVTPYAWMSGIDGDLGTIPGYPAQSVDLSFGDIWDDLDYGLFLFASARNGPWVFYLDSSAVQTTSKENVNGPTVKSVEIESRTSNLAMAVGRTVAAAPGYNLDVYGGFRYWSLENDYKVRTAAATYRKDTDADWTDPIIGLAGRYELAEKWTAFGSADIGGFGAGADLEWTVTAGVNWAFSDLAALSVGWRHLYIDYDDDGTVYDVTQSGPILGLTFKF
ncbi:hypothetical protein [Mangrovicoccus sp. HB161399]|uniref:hypothetical protein n=1 Tax=Mangrovicoccus sp. HB161399 TaxID=2720392 RepID=UPI0015533194|nr:hypothetical protein [Mangrovicoccus sp. HB161399]